MAKGPKQTRANLPGDVAMAEKTIDRAIEVSDGRLIKVSAMSIGITKDDWIHVLQPQYLAAGWKKAEWCVGNEHGECCDYIELICDDPR